MSTLHNGDRQKGYTPPPSGQNRKCRRQRLQHAKRAEGSEASRRGIHPNTGSKGWRKKKMKSK